MMVMVVAHQVVGSGKIAGRFEAATGKTPSDHPKGTELITCKIRELELHLGQVHVTVAVVPRAPSHFTSRLLSNHRWPTPNKLPSSLVGRV
jgi:hypothetical protein